MKINKKISLILVFAMVIQLFSASFVLAQDEEVAKTPIATAEYDFFSTLGMLDPAVTFYEGEAITRAQFAYIAARLIGFDGQPNEGATSRFSDVAASSSYVTAVNYLYDNGVVRGTGNSNFQPEVPITFNDASAIIVKILGYDKIAAAKYGSYPICNIRMADSLDIYLDMAVPQGTASITTAEALIMFKNAIYAPMAMMSVYGDEASTYTYEGKNTLLYVYHDIVRDEGVVTDDGVTSISGVSSLKDGGAVIGGKTFKSAANGFKANGLLGAYVDYYYVEKTNKLVYAEININSTNNITISFDQLAAGSPDFSLTNVVYYETENKTKDARISMTADFIYNGGLYNSYTLDDLKIESGYMTLIDRNEDKIFDVVNITEYQDYIIGNINKEDNIIYTKSKSIELDKYDMSIIVNHKDTEITISDMFAGNIISVAASKDYSNITVVYGNVPVQGVVTKAETTENIYYMGENAYEFSNDFVKNAKASDYPTIGESYRFFINADGFVAHIEELDSDAWYKGYLIGIAPESGSALDTTAVAGIIGADGELTQYYLSKNITLNGNRVKSTDIATEPAVYDSQNNIPIRQPVKYKLDEWGELKQIETPVSIIDDASYAYNYDIERFSKDRYYENAAWKGDSVNAIAGIYFVSTNSLVVRDPYIDDPNGAFKYDDVDIASYNEYKSFSGIGNAYLYDIDEANNVGYVCFKKNTAGSGSGSWHRSLFVVESVYRALEVDEDGENEEIKVVKGARTGKSITFYEDKEEYIIPDTLRNGDICLAEVNGEYITRLMVVGNVSKYDAQGNEVAPLASGQLYGDSSFVNSELTVFAGPVYGSSDTGVVILGWDDAYKLLGTSNNGYPTKGMAIYDRESGKITAGTIQDIYTNLVPDEKGNVTVDDDTPRAIIYRRYDYIVDIIFVK